MKAIKNLALFVYVFCRLTVLGHAGQVAFDGTTGSAGPVTGPNFTIPDSAGQTRGGNLFHSFSQFNLSEGETATFTGPTSVHNVIARVTGGPSVINGTIECNIAGANLYIINPFGITFGQHAQVNVNGSFAATTADYLKLADGGRFDARNPSRDVLTAAPPSAFGFLGSSVAPISIEGPEVPDLEPTFIEVPDGKSIWIVGGDVQIHNRFLSAPAGEIVVVGCASKGVLPCDLDNPRAFVDTTDFSNLADLRLDNGVELFVTGEPSGQIVMEGNNIVTSDALLSAYNLGSTAGGSIIITGRRSLHFDLLTAGTYAINDGDGGDIKLSSPSIYLTHSSFGTDTVGTGNSGNIQIDAGEFTMFAGAGISVNSGTGGGAGGNLVLNADHIRLEGANGEAPSLNGYAFGGPAGSIVINARTIDLLGGGSIQTDSARAGAPGGNIRITARSLFADRLGAFDLFTGISSRSIDSGSGGGNIFLEVGRLELRNGAKVTASSQNSGNSGSVFIEANNVLVKSGSSIESAASSDGDAGSVTMEIQRLLRLDHGMISVSSAQTRGGDINLKVKRKIHLRHGSITTEAFQDGGNIHVESGGLVYFQDSFVTAKSVTGNGGNLTIDPPFVVLQNSSLVASAIQGNGGNILVEAPNFLTIGNNQTDASSELGVPGTVAIDAPLIDLPVNLIPIQNKPLEKQTALEPGCSVRLPGGVSSLTVVGPDGTAVDPDGLLPAYPEKRSGQ